MIDANAMSTSAPGLDTAGVYNDFHGLAQLRREAQGSSPETVRKVAQQFEAVFIQMMLKGMRNTGIEDELFGSDQEKFYRDMFDEQLALDLSEKGALGLADMLVRQLSRQPAQDTAGVAAQSAGPPPLAAVERSAPTRARQAETALSLQAAATFTEAATPAASSPSIEPAAAREDEIRSPEDFIRVLAPYAEDAAQELGVSPRVLLAQAALETGWGKSVMRNADGSSSHNLFGIKADARWSGGRVVSETLEYEDGIAMRRRDTFRSYDSYKESFADYTDFLRSSPRYDAALADGTDGATFLQRLQEAGYATDPEYARKISRIAYGEGSRIAGHFKDSSVMPLTESDENAT